MTITLPQKELPVLLSAQVCVIGGGSAGIAAAAAAAKNGAKTILVERLAFLGGTTTAGMVCIWHLSDGEKQVVKGVAQELVERFPLTGPDAIQVTPGYPVLPGKSADKSHEFPVEIAKRVFEEYVTECGAELLYYTTVADVILDGDRIQALAVATKNGMQAICADYFVDCSGDANIAAMAGVPFHFGRNEDGRVQGMTMMFQLGGIDGTACEKYTFHSPETQKILDDMARERDAGRFPPFGPIDFHYYWKGGHANMNPASGDPTDERELTRCTLETRARIPKYLEYYREHVPGFQEVYVTRCADEIGIRESRRICGKKTFTLEDMMAERRFSDAIGHGFWCLDIHDPKGSGSTTWEEGSKRHFALPKGHSYQIPFGILVPEKITNLLVAGRCVSASHEGIASLRIQSACMVMGQAAGTACAMASETKIPLSEVDISALQYRLRTQGAYIEPLPDSE